MTAKPSEHTINPPATRPAAIVRERKAFYDLERWSKYNDPLLVIGFLILTVSVALTWLPYSLPVGGILFGVGVMRLAWMMGRAK